MILVCFAHLVTSFPDWPPVYSFRGTWKVPYINLTSPITVVQWPDHQYYEQQNGLLRQWNTDATQKFHRKTVVAENETICYEWDKRTEWDIKLTEFLPKPDGFTKHDGTISYNGVVCELWEKVIDSGKTQTYRIYINAETGDPVAYVCNAISIFGSHYDLYVLEINEFLRDALPGAWNLPYVCTHGQLIPDPYPVLQSNLFFPSSDENYKGKISSKFANMEPAKWTKLATIRKNFGSNDEEICKTYKYSGKIDLPEEWSWRNVSGIVGPPRDQVSCGSCWAFGTAEMIESAFALRTKRTKEISVQQIIDCTWNAGNRGCQGGDIRRSLGSLMKYNQSLSWEPDYPYLGVTGTCERNIKNPAGRIVECYHIESTTNAVKEALYKFGPLAVDVGVVGGWSFYNGGVYDDETCVGQYSDTNHIVLLTGWLKMDGREVWEVKNSWSTHWGAEGYIYIQSENQEWNCGITTSAVAVVVEPQ